MHEYIRQFEIPMHDLMLIKGFECIQDLYEELNGLFLRQCLVLLEVLREIAFVAVLKNEVEVVGSLLDVVQLYDVFVIAGLEHFYLVLEQFQELAWVRDMGYP